MASAENTAERAVNRATADGLAALVARASAGGKRPPVELWNPPFCGDLDIRIDRDGRWFYLGSPIGREALVRLFASVLRREGDRFFLVTPVEKVGITVEDAPFLAVEMHAEGEGADRRLLVRTNVGDLVEVGPDHPIRFHLDKATEGIVPYVHVRAGLEAKFTRALTHEAMDLVEEGASGGLALGAGGVLHPLPPEAMGSG